MWHYQPTSRISAISSHHWYFAYRWFVSHSNRITFINLKKTQFTRFAVNVTGFIPGTGNSCVFIPFAGWIVNMRKYTFLIFTTETIAYPIGNWALIQSQETMFISDKILFSNYPIWGSNPAPHVNANKSGITLHYKGDYTLVKIR